MKSAVRLDRRFDVARLVRDLEAAERFGVDHLHYSAADHDGGWSAIPLVSLEGATDADALKPRKGAFLKTPVLRACPYFDEIVDSFDGEKERVRLMRLAPGSRIFPHTDGPRFSWAVGVIARMHIPIVTHEDVRFVVNGQRLVMAPGDLWYCDTSYTHEVSNQTSISRVHLVIDLVMNDRVRAMLPPEPWWERGWNVSRRLSQKPREYARRLRAALREARAPRQPPS